MRKVFVRTFEEVKRTKMTVDATSSLFTPLNRAPAPTAAITPGSIQAQIPVGTGFPVVILYA